MYVRNISWVVSFPKLQVRSHQQIVFDGVVVARPVAYAKWCDLHYSWSRMTIYVGIASQSIVMSAKKHYEFQILENTTFANSNNVWSSVASNAINALIVDGRLKQGIFKTKTMNVTIVLTPNGAQVVEHMSVAFILDNWTTNESETMR